MIDSRDAGEAIMKRNQADSSTTGPSREDAFVHTAADAARVVASANTHLTSGNVLWTLTQRDSTAQARRWITPSGLELEMQIWTGAKVEGQEDLSWTQMFPSEETLADAALAKKRQLEAAGWMEDIDTTPL
jgi:hypothetical protein